jgi:hypothetical protein
MSTPGIGKSSTLELYSKVRDLNLTTVIASQYAPDDILGIQAVSNGKLERLAPYWYNELIKKSSNGKDNLLFIDEITTCNEFIQAPLLNLIFNKSLGGHTLPENTYIIAAGNYEDCLNNAFRMSAPLVNRFLILNLNNSDVNLKELLSVNFKELANSGSEDLIEYLGLSPSDFISMSSVKSLIKVLVELKVDNYEINNSIETGLTGFLSIRSLSYCKRLIETANSLGYMDSMVKSVICDTLGPNTSVDLPSTISPYFSVSDVKVKSSNVYQTASVAKLKSLIKNLIDDPTGITPNIYRAIIARSEEIPEELLDKFKETVLNL